MSVVSCERNWAKIFLFQNVNLIEIDNDQDPIVNGENVDIDGKLNDGLNDIELKNDEDLTEERNGEVETLEIQETAQESAQDIAQETLEYETSKTNEVDEDLQSSNHEEVSSQMSEDQDETVINNDNYDNNNDSAYETNEINSQNGSDSRLQSADTNGGDVDNETGENFLLQNELEHLEIERLENELENPPTPVEDDDDDCDVVLSAENPTMTGKSTHDVEVEVDKEEVHWLLTVLLIWPLYCLYCIIHPRMHHNL